MKHNRAKCRSGILSLRLATALLACNLIPLLAFAAIPGWWSQREVVNPNLSPDDYALANEGQLKNIARAAVAEFDAHMPGGAGNVLHSLLDGWSQPNPQRNDFAPVNLGQLKHVAKPFYDRLITVNYATNYPWTGRPNPPDDFAIANIGQVKHLFRFDLLAVDLAHDSDQNGLPDWWETYYFGHSNVDPNAFAGRGDGLTNLQAFQQGLNPVDYYNGQSPSLIIVSGDNQESPSGSFLPLPFVVKVTDNANNPLNNAPVTFMVTDGGGLLAESAEGATAPTLQLRTESDGTVSAYYQQPPEPGVTSHIGAAASVAQVVFTAASENSQVAPGLTLSPDNLSEIVNAGQIASRAVTLTNNSDATHQFTAELENSYSAEVSYTDSDQPGGPSFIWNDISATGTRLDNISDADDGVEAIDLRFAFPYFGDPYRQIYVSSNGFVTVGQSVQQYENFSLPNETMPANEIAAFHTDLDLGASGDVYYQDFTDRLVVQFTNAARYAGDGLVTFQIVLNADGTIVFYYKEMTGTIEDATVGVQDSTKQKGLTIAYQQPYLKNNLAVRLTISSERFNNSVDSVVWNDSDRNGGPDFVWNDISATGTRLNDISDADDAFEAFNISFSFPYFGSSYSIVFVSSNGYVTLGAGSDSYRTGQLPDSGMPVNDIAAFQNDLNLGASGDVYYRDYGDHAIIQFSNAARYAGDGLATFQIVLNRDGTILFYYKEMSGTVDGATVGIQNASGDKGITIIDQQPYLKNSLAIRITTTTHWLQVSPATGSLAAGENAALAIILNAQDLSAGLFHGRVNVTIDDSPIPTVLLPVAMAVNKGPEVTLTSPDEGSLYVVGEDVNCGATALDPDGVSRVEFYGGDIQLGESSSAGFLFAWRNVPAGVHRIIARAIDTRGATTRSQPVVVDVQLDINHNGMGDAWEMAHFGNLDQTADGDFDQDGISNIAEFHGRTDPAVPTSPEQQYAIIGLGNIIPAAVNNLGQVVGQCFDAPTRACIWENGMLKPLAPLENNTDCWATAINDSGTIAGHSSYAYPDPDQLVPEQYENGPGRMIHACFWQGSNGVATSLGDLTHDDGTNEEAPVFQYAPEHSYSTPDATNHGSSYARAINASGQVAGESDTYIDVNGYWPWVMGVQNFDRHACVFPSGDLGLLAPGTGRIRTVSETYNGNTIRYWLYSRTLGINDGGTVVGTSLTGQIANHHAVTHAFRSAGAGMIDLGTLGGDSFATAISNSGHIVGYSDGGAFAIWAGAAMRPLPNTTSGRPAGVNRAGVVVGKDFQGSSSQAVIWQNGHDALLNSRISESVTLLSAAAISDSGLIVCSGFSSTMQGGGFLLLPVELMVDGNRDGEMSFTDGAIRDKDGTSEEKPYRFWVNDDQDNVVIGTVPTSYGDGETVPASNPNYNDPNIKTARDLEDWSRLWISFKGLTDLVKAPDVTVELWFEATEGQPSIKVCQAVEPDGGTQYISDIDTATLQISGNPDVVYGPISANTALNLKDNAHSDWIDNLSEANPDLHLLFEGAGEGEGKLQLTIKRAGQVIGQYPPLYLDLKNVRKMYERAKATPDNISPPHEYTATPPLPSVSFVINPDGNQWSYPSVSWAETNEYVVYVHGWNVTYNEAISNANTTFKRLWQRGYRGRFASMYWPTYVGIATYNRSEYRAWFFGESLKQYVNSLPAAYTKNLIAHSMGNIVAGSALRKGMLVANYAMLDAAVPASCYDSSPLLQQPYGLTPDNDTDLPTLALAYRDKLSSVNVNLINFYLESDDALRLWRDNNAYFKPEVFYELAGTDHAYKYYPGNPSGQKLFLSFVISPYRYLQQMEEALAYASKSSTKAVGSEGNAHGSVSISVNLADFGYENEHSAFWSFTMQQMKPAYNNLMDKVRVEHNP